MATIVTDKQIASLEQHIEKEREVRRSCDHAKATLLSSEFHLLAAQMADDDVLAGVLRSRTSRTSLILAQHSAHKETDCTVDEHTAILPALRSRDPKASAAAIVQHLRQVERANGQTHASQAESERSSLSLRMIGLWLALKVVDAAGCATHCQKAHDPRGALAIKEATDRPYLVGPQGLAWLWSADQRSMLARNIKYLVLRGGRELTVCFRVVISG
ncbi:FCD domain-containing protein [Pseudaminobacter sp. NGMCC 1.201702]|uniref:FCD domain-containing protein n=1 Tax=Pseudaminobacter sp. NGMCC 1.201702 TaxID=3391825 RepID=UPI0039EE9D20